MPTLQGFVTAQELDPFVKDLSVAKNLDGCQWLNHQQYVRVDPQTAESLLEKDEQLVSRLYLFPSNQELPDTPNEDMIQPRLRGWLSITPGELLQNAEQSILTMVSIDCEDRKDLDFKPSAWLRALKRQLSKAMSFGTEGVNMKFGGSAIYKSVFYSPQALQLFEQGVIWQQKGVKNVIFHPIDSTD